MMRRPTTLHALLLLAAASGCGGDVKTYRANAPASSASAKTAAPDPQAWRAERPKPGPPGAVRFPTPELVKLPSGLSLAVVPTAAEVVTLRFVVRHGASSVPEGKSGLAALTARMMTEGTRKRSSLELAEQAEALGSSLESDAGRDESIIGTSALSGDVDRALELLAEVVTQPAFDEKEFERVRAEWLDGLVAERQSPDRLASLAGLRLLNGQVHGAPVSGGVSEVKRLTTKDLAEFHTRRWQPGNSALVLVGKVDTASVRASVDKHFKAFKARAVTPDKPAALPPGPERLRVVLVDRPGAVQSAVFGAHRFPARAEPGFEARELLGEIVGGLFTSRINQNLREKHAYTYGARGRPVATRHWGAFVVSTSVRTDVTVPALEQILVELKKARDPGLGAPIEPAELDRGRADLLHSLGARLEHTSRIADAVVGQFVAELGQDYYARYPATLAAIVAGEVSENAKLLAPERMVFVIAGDTSRFAPELAKLGAAVENANEALTD
jgi:zinc protease